MTVIFDGGRPPYLLTTATTSISGSAWRICADQTWGELHLSLFKRLTRKHRFWTKPQTPDFNKTGINRILARSLVWRQISSDARSNPSNLRQFQTVTKGQGFELTEATIFDALR